MFSHQLYNVLHVVGLVFLVAALGGIAFAAESDGSKSGWAKRYLIAFQGIGLFLILLGGFGMLARLGIVKGTIWPGWVSTKMAIWIALGIAGFLPYRYPWTARPLLLLLPLLGGVAAYMAIYKPY